MSWYPTITKKLNKKGHAHASKYMTSQIIKHITIYRKNIVDDYYLFRSLTNCYYL